MIASLVCVLLAVTPHGVEGDAQAFTSLTDAHGAPLADARYAQWVTGDTLHIATRSDFPGGRVIEEKATLRLHPQIEQESWEWTERDGDKPLRQYSVDFASGEAVATRFDQQKRWKEHLDDIAPGKTFAGIGFITAVKALRGSLQPGQEVKLKAVAMTPRPRTATVSVRRDGPDPVRMASRTIPGDRYTIHPEIPAIVRLFVHAPDQHIWLVASDPAAFLRFEGPLLEPTDPVIRIDLIPGPPAHGEARVPRTLPRPAHAQ